MLEKLEKHQTTKRHKGRGKPRVPLGTRKLWFQTLRERESDGKVEKGKKKDLGIQCRKGYPALRKGKTSRREFHAKTEKVERG